MPKKVYDIKPPEKKSKEAAGQPENKNGKSKSKFIAGLAAVVLVVAAIVYFFSYRAVVEIHPVTEGIELEQRVSLDVEWDGLEEGLPAIVYETDFFEEYDQFEATGLETEDGKASGEIKIHNTHWSANQPLVEGTRFESEEGLIFEMKNRVIVPAGSQTDPGTVVVEVEATEAGEEYNLDSGEFNLPGLEGSPSYDGVWGEVETELTGGFVGERKVVTEEDITSALEELESRILEEGRSLLEAEKQNEGYLLEDGSQYNVRTEMETVEANPGEATEEFQAELRAEVELMTFHESDFTDLLIEKLAENSDRQEFTDLESERVVYEDSLSYDYELIEADWREGTGSLEVEWAGEVYSSLNESRLKETAGGSSRENLASDLEAEEFIREVSVYFRPFGIGSIPENPDRIEILLEF